MNARTHTTTCTDTIRMHVDTSKYNHMDMPKLTAQEQESATSKIQNYVVTG